MDVAMSKREGRIPGAWKADIMIDRHHPFPPPTPGLISKIWGQRGLAGFPCLCPTETIAKQQGKKYTNSSAPPRPQQGIEADLSLFIPPKFRLTRTWRWPKQTSLAPACTVSRKTTPHLPRLQSPYVSRATQTGQSVNISSRPATLP